MNAILTEKLERAKNIVLLGHVRPDGDCVGSVLALYLYLKKTAPSKQVTVCLEKPLEKFNYLSGFSEIVTDADAVSVPDLAVALDVSDKGRLGGFQRLFDDAKDTLNIDHHITNPHFAATTICEPEASSTCELLYTLLDFDQVDEPIAAALYTGIVTDSGVFKYGSTSARTMRIAGELMEKGIPFGEIIDGAFYRKTFVQNQIMGLALLHAVENADKTVIYSIVTEEEQRRLGTVHADLDGISEQLRLTAGVKCAVLCSEMEPGSWKLSLRSLEPVDVAAIAMRYGGGGHIRAAGCTIVGKRAEEIMEEVVRAAEAQLHV